MSTPLPDKNRLIFEKWKADLSGKSRATEAVNSNFEDLFDALYRAGATFQEAYALLPEAIKAHLPPPSTIRLFWKRDKKNHDSTEKEYGEKWCKDIEDRGTSMFYAIFPLPEGHDDQDPKVYGDGKVSEREHRLQRDHASRFKKMDLSSLPDPNQNLMSEEELYEFLKRQMDNE